MPEFTVGETRENTDNSKSIVDEAIENLIQDVKSDKQKQAKIAQALHENYGIDPQLLATFVDVPVEADQNGAAPAETTQPEPTPKVPKATGETKTVTKEPTPDEVIGFIDELTDYLDEDTTLAELKEYAEDNKDLLATAIELHF